MLQNIYNGQTVRYFQYEKLHSLENSAYYTVLSPVYSTKRNIIAIRNTENIVCSK